MMGYDRRSFIVDTQISNTPILPNPSQILSILVQQPPPSKPIIPIIHIMVQKLVEILRSAQNDMGARRNDTVLRSR